jgi:TnpA family transposase
MRRQQLTEAQTAALFDPPMEPRELVRHYTLAETDFAMIRRCRGDHSRLGYALMLCYMRHPGRPLRTNERPPAALVSFVAEQIDVRPAAIDDYLASEQNRRRHAAELQDRLGLSPFGKHVEGVLKIAPIEKSTPKVRDASANLA